MRIYALFFAAIANVSSAFGQAYNLSDDFIGVSHERSQYFISESNASLRFDDFLKKADKNKPVVIHSHGCAGVENDTFALKDFYVSLGSSVVILDFIKRGDASPCNHLGANNSNYKDDSQKYIADLKFRIPARVKELEHHIKLMRTNGFNVIFATGHSEGGMVVQRLNEKVDGVIVHSMTCFPTTIDTSFNRYLHLVSINDPLLTKTSGRKFGCTDKSNFTVVQSEVKSHAAFADPSWKEHIRNFIKDSSTPK
jgi:predicted esterase